MPFESQATLQSAEASSSHRRRRRHHREEDKEHSSRRKSTAKDASAGTYVYGPPAERPKSSRITIKETRRLGRDGESSESESDEVVRPSRERKPAEKEKKIKVIYVKREELKSSRTKDRRRYSTSELPRDTRDTLKRSSTHRRRPTVTELPETPPKRTTSTRDIASALSPVLRRSNTTSTNISPVRIRSYAPQSPSTAKRSSFLGGLFAPAPPKPEPEQLVECLTCLSDDVPKSKSAKLKCGHRMCNSCLKRIFRLSVKDPQHMPPKCCTADHISLTHVEKLFDNNFKKLWNMKFAEYSTKNRIYCPARRCGEWIRPADIHKENGKKFGKCGRCKTKVCVACNGKWHSTKDCPKDEETNQLLEAAKQAGWQRCYSCRTMVELKEGCNHMTCRCTAEFCMICGLKWKTCNCPWFNYEAVEADRLNHMQVPQDPADVDPLEPRPRRLRRPRPNTYNDELTERQRQERLEERLARRLQRTTLGDDADDDYQGGLGDIHGVGNGAGHFMNQDYVRAAHNILTGNFNHEAAAANYVMGVANARGAPAPRPNAGRIPDRAPALPRVERAASPPPPLLRRHSAREQAYNAAQTRPSERVVPRRTRVDYEAEAAVHAPVPIVVRPFEPEPRQAVLAGLKETGRARNRVSAWRAHVGLGVTPEEGVFSV